MTHIMRGTVAISILCVLMGCARYEYQLVQPPDLAQHIDAKHDATFTLGPLRYRLRTAENHLVMRIYNQSETPIRLLGDQSFVVDPGGQSHPLQSQSCAPNSYIKLIFPPLRPQLEPTGPSIGIGIGGFVGRGPFRDGFYSGIWDPYYDTPRYYTVYEGNSSYWDWDGEGEARLSIVFQQGQEKPFTHEFVLDRRKM
jgi:hypothetical protein